MIPNRPETHKKIKSVHVLAVTIPLAIIFIGIFVALAVDNKLEAQSKTYSTEDVVESAWNKYEVQSTQIGGEDTGKDISPTIWVDVYNEDDIPKIEQYLQNNLSKADLKHYELDVSLYKGN